MSEYQYYEFQAIDRPLEEADRQALQALSTRARITATSFTNSYEWGDFKGDPAKLMERWFDLHLYIANWGSRRLMMRLPKRLVDTTGLDLFIGEVDAVTVRMSHDNMILDISFDEIESDDDWDDGADRLAALAPLRADILAGDLRVFYLLWLTAVSADTFEADYPEPMPGIGPMTGALQAFAAFFKIDLDLVAAAAEQSPAAAATMSPDVARPVLEAMSDADKTAWLMRLFDGAPHAAAELRGTVRDRLAQRIKATPEPLRTVGHLRLRAEVMCNARKHAAAEKAAAERRRRAEDAEKARRAALDAVRRRGESAWRDVENDIEIRNAASYDRAAGLLQQLRMLAGEQGTIEDFSRRLRAIRTRHERKKGFIERLKGLE